MPVQRVDISPEVLNQRVFITIEVNGKLLELVVHFRYNDMAGYWAVSIKDVVNNKIVISSMPLLAMQNLLAQYEYLRIGSMAIINVANVPKDSLNRFNIGTDFVMIWSDNSE